MKLPPEQEAIRARYFHRSEAFVEFPKADVQTSIPERFEKIVRTYPDRLAVQAKSHTLTYDQLNRAANRIARAVLERCSGRNEPVAVLMEQGALAVIAILGVLKAGGIYVPLDSTFPDRRLKYLLEDSTATVILTNSDNFQFAETLASNRVRTLNVDTLRCANSAVENPNLSIRSTNLAAIIYTSGSSGQPKGVIQNHRNLLHLVMRSTNFYGLCSDDRIALLRSFSVSGGTLHILEALLNGAALLPFDLKQQGVANLAKWLVRAAVTNCSFNPRTLRHLTEFLNQNENFPELRRVTVSGEPLYSSEMNLCRKYFSPGCVFVNSLGATEIPFAAQYVVRDRKGPETNLVPVGVPTKDIELRLIQEDGRDIHAGEIGEIVIRSRYLALGYWRSPELTQQKFLPDPEGGDKRDYLTGDIGRFLSDGALLHLGRKDHVVKIRGYRVSLLEIEMTLLEYPHLKEAAVAIWEDAAREQYLAAYLVVGPGRTPTVSQLSRFLRARLPDYMVPSRFKFLERLPQINGKVDRHALPPPEAIRPSLDQAYSAATKPIETHLVRLWEEVLGIHPIGIHDNFFDLGGNSLSVSRLTSQLLKTLQVELPVKAVFESPTVAAMAGVIAEHQGKKLSQKGLEQILSELESLSDDEAQKRLGNSRSPAVKNE